MSEAIKLLLAEDSEDDARLVVLELKRGGFEARHERVESAAAMAAALQRQAWDVVISDYNMPGFSGMDALRILRSTGLDIPFVLISGTVGEEIAVEALKAGAGDYVLKKNLSRLPLVLKRELAEAAVRRAQRQSEVELRKLSLAVRQSGTGIVITDPVGAIEFVNPKFEAMTGYSASEVNGKNMSFLKSGLTPLETYRDLWETITAGKEWRGEIQNRKKSGELYWEKQHISPISSDDGAIRNFIAVKDDVTERKRAETALREREAGLRQAQQIARLGHAVTRADGSFESWSETLPALIGMEAGRFPKSTREWIEHLHPDDRAMFRARSVEASRTRARVDIEYRLQGGDGNWVHFRHVMEPLREPEEASGATRWFNTVQDVTEHKRAEAAILESEQRVRRLNRVHAVLSGINTLIVRVPSREELFKEACRIAVDHGKFHVAWIAAVKRDPDRVDLVAHYGGAPEFAETLRNKDWLGADKDGNRSAIGRVLVERKAVFSNDIRTDPRIRYTNDHVQHGRSIAVLPLIVADSVVAVLCLHAPEVGFFDEEEQKLLLELAGDISFALDHLEKGNQLDYLAFYDSLTGLANRALFSDRLNGLARAAGQAGSGFAVAMLDIERLRTINESLGRQTGDELLKQVAQRLERAAGAAAVSRSAADHFAVVLNPVDDRAEAERRIQEIARACFEKPFQASGSELKLVAKIGIALFPDDGAESETLLKNAEAALRKAKALGERHVFYTVDLTEQTARSLTLENKLRQALEKEEFVLHYQPKVDLEARRIVGVEALIRWQSPELGLVPPMKFIPLMEETGMILEVGAWALRKASSDHRIWVEQGLRAPRVAVNVSAIQLRQRDFVSSVEAAILEGIAPTGIDLEITESLLMGDIEGNIEKLKSVRGLGVSLAIDDFGTGYSSLGYLAKLPVQALKIDRSFIITMLGDPDAMTLVQTMISLAHSLKLKVVAEGVDAEEQAKVLRLLRCDQMQGYLFSKPLPFEEMTALLKQQPKE